MVESKNQVESESNNSSQKYESSPGDIEEEELTEDVSSSFSLSNSDFDELGFS